jgi:hypothetical protein
MEGWRGCVGLGKDGEITSGAQYLSSRWNNARNIESSKNVDGVMYHAYLLYIHEISCTVRPTKSLKINIKS